MLHDVPDLLAAGMGRRVDEVPLDDGWPHGLWVPERQQIILRFGLDRVTRRCVLAHELGHDHHRDVRSGFDSLDGKAERRADAFATLLLISPSVAGLAHALDVTPHLIRVWRGEHERQAP
ncbi:ImmA/IrrE family metallo-endopeptidase [Corynebacterium sp. NPDC060344]|uniref:ImmA/IrrE family metallo-endopeptidase n=1 Tax=Corynebacterium sp. NPDC060344 TaxID=3347101 RepID=UPI00366A2E15